MELIRLELLTKHNKKNGFYLYTPIVKVNGSFFWCESIKSSKILKISEVSVETLKITRQIPIEFYEANGINV